MKGEVHFFARGVLHQDEGADKDQDEGRRQAHVPTNPG